MRRALVSWGTAMCIALSACGESADEVSDASTEALDAATRLADLSVGVTDLANELAAVDQAEEAKRIEKELEAARSDAEVITDEIASTPTGRWLGSAAQATADAAHELDETAAGLGAAIAEGKGNREVSDEASTDLARQSRDIDRLVVRVSAAGGQLDEAARELGRALRAIGTDSELTTEAQGRLDTIRRDIPTLGRNATRAISSLKRAVRSEADFLSTRSEELKPEPPDVVLDCTSTVSTASDVSVRNLSCEEADALILQAIPALAQSFSVGEYTCTILGDYGPPDGPILGAEDIRCESGDRAFRFGFGD